MATDQLLAPLADIFLEKNYTLQFAAIDPATGAPVTGVLVNNASVTTDQGAGFEQTSPVPPNVLGAYLPPATAGNTPV